MNMRDSYYLARAEEIFGMLAGEPSYVRSLWIRRILSVALTVGWYAFWLYTAFHYFASPYATPNPKNVMMYLSIVLLTVLPFVLFKPQRCVTDRSFAGEITQIKLHNHVGNVTLAGRVSATVTLRRLDNGKKKKICFTMKPGLKEYYPVGCLVCKAAGLAYPIRLELSEKEKRQDAVFCHRCGFFNAEQYTYCFECSGKLLLKDRQLRETEY